MRSEHSHAMSLHVSHCAKYFAVDAHIISWTDSLYPFHVLFIL